MPRKDILTLLAQLAAPELRRAAARGLAQCLGADDLVIFVADPELGVLLPAPGFPQTIPGGRAWRAFLAKSAADGQHTAELPYPGSSTPVMALGAGAGMGPF